MSNTAEGLSEEAEDDISQVNYCVGFVGMYRIFILSNIRLSCPCFFMLHHRSCTHLINAPARTVFIPRHWYRWYGMFLMIITKIFDWDILLNLNVIIILKSVLWVRIRNELKLWPDPDPAQVP
jgi:hypothetical protein